MHFVQQVNSKCILKVKLKIFATLDLPYNLAIMSEALLDHMVTAYLVF